MCGAELRLGVGMDSPAPRILELQSAVHVFSVGSDRNNRVPMSLVEILVSFAARRLSVIYAIWISNGWERKARNIYPKSHSMLRSVKLIQLRVGSSTTLHIFPTHCIVCYQRKAYFIDEPPNAPAKGANLIQRDFPTE